MHPYFQICHSLDLFTLPAQCQVHCLFLFPFPVLISASLLPCCPSPTMPPPASTLRTRLHLLRLLKISSYKSHYSQQKNYISSREVHRTKLWGSSASAYNFRSLSNHRTFLLPPSSTASVPQTYLRKHLWPWLMPN